MMVPSSILSSGADTKSGLRGDGTVSAVLRGARRSRQRRLLLDERASDAGGVVSDGIVSGALAPPTTRRKGDGRLCPRGTQET